MQEHGEVAAHFAIIQAQQFVPCAAHNDPVAFLDGQTQAERLERRRQPDTLACVNINSIAVTIRAAAAIALIASLSGGCYLLQSAEGQLTLMSKREPISRVIDAPSTPAKLRAQLKSVTAIRNFASHELGLPDNGSYRKYADIGRPYVVWNVVAAPEFSVEPKKWCFPIVGCVGLPGLFRRGQSAQLRRGTARSRLRRRGRRRRCLFHARVISTIPF